MKEFVEKLIGRLEEKFKYNSEQAEIWRNGSDKDAFFREKKDLYMDRANTYGEVMRIVNQLAEEYKQCTLCYLQSPCEYQNADIRVDDSSGWIPCSERKPEIGQTVLATVSQECILINEVITIDYDAEFWQFFEDGSLLAWMPLPAPFKKGE